MKILFTQDTDWVSRFPGQQHHIAERLKNKGHSIRVIDYDITWRTKNFNGFFSSRQDFFVSKVFPDTNIHIIRPGIIKIPIIDYFSMLITYWYGINRVIDEFKPDIIIGHSILTNYISLKLAKQKNIPFVFHMTDAQHTMIPYHFLQPIGKLIEQKNLSGANCVIVINEILKEYAISMGANPEKTYVIRAGIDHEKYDPKKYSLKLRERYNISPNDIAILFIGWLYHFSGLKELIVEFSKIHEKNPHLKILICGEGDAFPELKSLANKYNLNSKVIFSGKIPFDEVPEHIFISNVCVLPAYLNDTMKHIVPIKMYEYMIMGKPVVATRLPGILKEFGHDHGVVYINESKDAIYTILDLISKKTIDENGQRARNYVKNLNWNNTTDEFERVLFDMVKEGF